MGPCFGWDDELFVMTAWNASNALNDIKGTIVLAGAGKMGGAMLSGWLAQGLDPRLLGVIEPHPSAEISALVAKGVHLNPTPKEIGAVAALVVALKPQMFREAGPMLQRYAGSSTLVVSIMAGTTIASITEACGGMGGCATPHTPAAVGRGLTGAGGPNDISAAPPAGAPAPL